MENKWTIMPWSTRIAVLVMVIALFALMFVAREHPEQQIVKEENWMWCTEAYNTQLKIMAASNYSYAEAASLMRELGCDAEANQLELNWQPKEENKYTPMDDNLTNSKPTEWWRLNSNGYSQRYVQLYGDTKNERIISMLQSYGFEDAETEARPAIRTISRIFQVQPEIIVCIAYADSSLWRFLKTSYNYGNVGNNDRWNTQSFNNMEQGFYHIGAVLNNGNLWKYSTVNQLSRRGNPDGMIYASSPENWHINVMNCLWMIHNKYVPDNFNYRW